MITVKGPDDNLPSSILCQIRMSSVLEAAFCGWPGMGCPRFQGSGSLLSCWPAVSIFNMKAAIMEASLAWNFNFCLVDHMDEETQSMGCLSSLFQMTLDHYKENLSALGFVLRFPLTWVQSYPQ